MTQKQFIDQKLKNGNFKKNGIYSSCKISEKIGSQNLNTNGMVKAALTNSKEWQHLYDRTWQFLGKTNDTTVIKKPESIAKESTPIKDIGLIRKFFKWIY